MLRFINKKDLFKNIQGSKMVIYYSISDIFLGSILLILVVFFIYNYLRFTNTHLAGVF